MKIEIEMKLKDCPTCGIIFAITEQLEARRREDGKDFYCPSAHRMSFGGSAVEGLEMKLEAVRARNLELSGDLSKERLSHIATKGKLTKERKKK